MTDTSENTLAAAQQLRTLLRARPLEDRFYIAKDMLFEGELNEIDGQLVIFTGAAYDANGGIAPFVGEEAADNTEEPCRT
jgi:hypothetical protein